MLYIVIHCFPFPYNSITASCEEDIQKLLDDPTTMDVLERCQLCSQLKVTKKY